MKNNSQNDKGKNDGIETKGFVLGASAMNAREIEFFKTLKPLENVANTIIGQANGALSKKDNSK